MSILRVVGFAFLFPLVLVILWRDAPEWVILTAWGAGFGLLFFGFSRGVAMSCPYCGKGVKLGADHCHHCGRAVYAEPTDPST